MMNKIHWLCFLLVWFWIVPHRVSGQQKTILNHAEACRLARENAPIYQNLALIASGGALDKQNMNAHWRPQMQFNGLMTLQSDVTHLELPVSTFQIPEIPKLQYRAYFELNQMVYDAGQIRHKKNLDNLQVLSSITEVNLKIDDIEKFVDQLYWNIHLLRKQKSIILWHRKVLESKSGDCQNLLNAGMATTGQCALIEAGIIALDQKISEIEFAHKAAIAQLGLLTGYPVTDSMDFPLPQVPADSLAFNGSFRKHELELFRLKMEIASESERLAISKKLPRISAFAQGGIGKPALNMLNPELKPFLYGGVRLNLPILQWNVPLREQKIARIQKEMFLNQKKQSEVMLTTRLIAMDNEIEKLRDLIAQDEYMLNLREKISTEARNQFDRGILSSSELLSRLAEEAEARLSLAIHNAQLSFTYWNKYRLLNQ